MIDPRYTVSIDKEALGKLPMASYEGDIQVVERPEDVDAALAELRRADIVGFDTETRPSFKKGQHFNVALIQLSTDTKCFLFRINRLGMMPSILEYLEDPAKAKIGLSLHDDFHNLLKLADFNPGGFVDLQDFVRPYGISDSSLTKIHAILFGQRISKGQRLTNWEAPTLTQAQQTYAALDAMACINIYRHLLTCGFDATSSPYYHLIPQPEE